MQLGLKQFYLIFPHFSFFLHDPIYRNSEVCVPILSIFCKFHAIVRGRCFKKWGACFSSSSLGGDSSLAALVCEMTTIGIGARVVAPCCCSLAHCTLCTLTSLKYGSLAVPELHIIFSFHPSPSSSAALLFFFLDLSGGRWSPKLASSGFGPPITPSMPSWSSKIARGGAHQMRYAARGEVNGQLCAPKRVVEALRVSWVQRLFCKFSYLFSLISAHLAYFSILIDRIWMCGMPFFAIPGFDFCKRIRETELKPERFFPLLSLKRE